MTDFRRLLGEVNVPTNILRLVAAWGTPVQKSEIAALFVAYVEAVANKAPLDRMSAFLSSGFRLVGLSGSSELQRRFLAAILLWLLEHRALPESEQAKFAFYVLRQTVGGLFDDDLVARSRELLMKSIFDPSAGLAMWNGVLAHLCRLTNVPYAPVSSAPWPPLPDWSPNILMPYLRSVNAIHVQEGATEFATRLWERWHAAQWVSAFEFGFVISSLGLVEEALTLVEPSTNVPDRRVAALSAVAVFELRRGRRVEAYDAFRKSVEEGDTARYRVSPRQAYAVQKEFERLGEPVLAPLHRMVAINLSTRLDLLVRDIELLREAVKCMRADRPFHIDAWVVFHDHMHCVITLSPGDDAFSNCIKVMSFFTGNGGAFIGTNGEG